MIVALYGDPATPVGIEVVVMASVLPTPREKPLVASAPDRSLTATVTLKLPPLSGVPDKAPVEGLMVSHPGPDTIAHVYDGGTPPVCVNWKE